MKMRTNQAQPGAQQLQLARRSGAESALGSAACQLEHAATLIEKLAIDGFTYPARNGEVLRHVQKLSDQLLALQVEIRTENHQ